MALFLYSIFLYTVPMITFSIREAFSYGWNMLKKNFWLLIEIFILIIGLGVISSYASEYATHQGVPWVSTLISIVEFCIQSIFVVGAMRIVLKIDKQEPTSIKEIFSVGKIVLTYIGGIILYVLIIGVGFILLVIPGFIWMIKYQFFPWLIVDKHMSAREALKASGVITKGNRWNLFLFWLASLATYIVGFILVGIGTIPAAAIIFMATFFIYKKLLKKLDQILPETTPIPQQ